MWVTREHDPLSNRILREVFAVRREALFTMFKHLLVPLDGSSFSEAALPYALGLARQFDGEITLLRVILPPRMGEGALTPDSADYVIRVRDDLYDEAIAYVKGIQDELASQSIRTHFQVVESDDTAAEIVGFLHESTVDAIVMSTHGRGGLGRWLFGSVANRVLQSATVPVVLIRPSKESLAKS